MDVIGSRLLDVFNLFNFLVLEGRNCKQVRERYVNKLDPKLNQEIWSTEEDMKLIDLYHQHGKRWSTISKFLENRS